MKAIFVLFLLPLQLFSQDLSGIWVGTIATSETQMPFELAINRDMTGYSMLTFMFKGAEKVAVKKITLLRKDSVFTISDDKLIYNNFETRSRSIKSFCELSIKMVDTIMVLSGPFHTRTRDLRAGDKDLATGTITLRKQNRQAQTKLIGKLDSLKLSNTLAFSDPKETIRESPPAAVSQKETAVAAAPQKAAPIAAPPQKESVPAAITQKEAAVEAAPQKAPPVAVSIKETPKTAESEKAPSPAASQKESAIAAAPQKPPPVVAASQKETPAVAERPEKDLTAVKVQQQVSSEKAKINPYSNAPSNITSTSAIPVNQKIIEAAAEVSLRKTEVIRSIDFGSDSITLVLYDNGIVDGDTVSVVLNGDVVIPKLGLTEQAYRKVIKIPPGMGDSLLLVIYAENLGSIPPNSGLLIIEDGTDRHRVAFEGDMKKSAAVQLRRKR